MADGPIIYHFTETDWVDEQAERSAPAAMVAAAEAAGARRKRMARGESGFHAQYSTMPAGFQVPPHSHDHAELLVVLAGGCTLMGEAGEPGPELTTNDTAVLEADQEYGFTCGPDGMQFLVVRTGAAAVTFKD